MNRATRLFLAAAGLVLIAAPFATTHGSLISMPVFVAGVVSIMVGVASLLTAVTR